MGCKKSQAFGVGDDEIWNKVQWHSFFPQVNPILVLVDCWTPSPWLCVIFFKWYRGFLASPVMFDARGRMETLNGALPVDSNWLECSTWFRFTRPNPDTEIDTIGCPAIAIQSPGWSAYRLVPKSRAAEFIPTPSSTLQCCAFQNSRHTRHIQLPLCFSWLRSQDSRRTGNR